MGVHSRFCRLVSGSGILGRLEAATSPDEFLGQFAMVPAVDGGAGHEKEVGAGGDELLVLPDDGPQASPGAVALDGGADRGGGGDKTDADKIRRRRGKGGGLGGRLGCR